MQTPAEDWEAQYRKPLTARQVQVLQCLADGYSTRETTTMLGITIGTLQCHVNNAKDRLGARSRLHLLLLALHAGYLHTAAV